MPACVAVIVHRPTPLMPPLVVQGPVALRTIGSPEEAEMPLSENLLPYCIFGKVGKMIVCDWVLEPCGRIVKVPDTELAAL